LHYTNETVELRRIYTKELRDNEIHNTNEPKKEKNEILISSPSKLPTKNTILIN